MTLVMNLRAESLPMCSSQAIRDMLKVPRGGYVSPRSAAALYAYLGEKKLALDLLDSAYVQRDPGLVFLNIRPSMDPLRSEPRFKDLVRRMNLPDSKGPSGQAGLPD